MRKVKESTRKSIIYAAKELFKQKSIASVTIQDIAREAKVGEATVYRYFGKKIYLAISCASTISDEIASNYLKVNDTDTGFQMIKKFYSVYLNVYEDNKNIFRFVNDFDSYIEQEGIETDDTYETSVDNYKEFFLKAYKKGIEDHTVLKIADPDTFYYSTTISLLNLCKKVSKKSILRSDELYDGKRLIMNMINIILKSLMA